MQMEFWTELSQDHPSLSVLDKAGTEYERCVKVADRGFQTVLQLDPTSVSAMRGYAQFLIEVSKYCSHDAALTCLSKGATFLSCFSSVHAGAWSCTLEDAHTGMHNAKYASIEWW